MSLFHHARTAIISSVLLAAAAAPARATDTLCDPSAENCRTRLITLIQNEQVGIDVGYWFMQDTRYTTEIIRRWQAGVPVRIVMDLTANNFNYPGNIDIINTFAQAGVPMRRRNPGNPVSIFHWKMMLFAGQNTVEFGSANYSPDAFVPVTPYVNYVGETVLFTDEPSIVNSFKTKYDDVWTNTVGFADHANITRPLWRAYPTYPIDPDLNFPPGDEYIPRTVAALDRETQAIDVLMYRLTDLRTTIAVINAHRRGVPVRVIVENEQYRGTTNATALVSHPFNLDLLYVSGVPVRWRGHQGQFHTKLVLLRSQAMSIFGSANWTSPEQFEHNYFATKPAMFQWFSDQFERMWNNSNPVGAIETVPFTPAPPGSPSYQLPANGATTGATVTLKWYGGPYAHFYDLYLGVTPNPPLVAANLYLGASATTTQFQSLPVPNLPPGITFYWKIVSKTVAGLATTGPEWRFTTAATGGLPSGWIEADVGAVGVAGSSSFTGAGLFFVSGGGADIWGNADAFHYVYQPLSGDGQIVARVAGVINVNAWSKGGVMIRGSLDAGAPNAIMLISAAKGSAFQARTTVGGLTTTTSGGTTTAAPQFVKIVRSGNTLTGYQSPDGATWTQVGSATLQLGTTAYIGLAVTSHDNTRQTTAAFDSVAR